jgi:hypothetical protein
MTLETISLPEVVVFFFDIAIPFSARATKFLNDAARKARIAAVQKFPRANANVTARSPVPMGNSRYARSI